MSKPIKGWCVQNKKSVLLYNSFIGITQDETIKDIEEECNITWHEMQEKGYRCVKIIIKEGWDE